MFFKDENIKLDKSLSSIVGVPEEKGGDTGSLKVIINGAPAWKSCLVTWLSPATNVYDGKIVILHLNDMDLWHHLKSNLQFLYLQNYLLTVTTENQQDEPNTWWVGRVVGSSMKKGGILLSLKIVTHPCLSFDVVSLIYRLYKIVSVFIVMLIICSGNPNLRTCRGIINIDRLAIF